MLPAQRSGGSDGQDDARRHGDAQGSSGGSSSGSSSSGSLPVFDRERLVALEASRILRLDPARGDRDAEFDRLTRLCKALLATPCAMANFLDAEETHIQSLAGGLPEPYMTRRKAPNRESICQIVVNRGKLLSIENAPATNFVCQVTDGTGDVVNVPDTGAVSYLGAPIRAPNGLVLGSFCAEDIRPRIWSEVEVQHLVDLTETINVTVKLRFELIEAENRSRELNDARAAAVSATAAKSQFLANMSHELRTPMNAILGLTELTLAGEATSGDVFSDATRENLQLVHQAGSSLLAIVSDVLDFSRIEAGQDTAVEAAPFSIPTVVGAVRDLLAATAAAKNIELVCHIAESLQAPVLGDARRLRQVLVNLVGNAVKFTQTGQVRIDVRNVTQDTASEAPRTTESTIHPVEILVTDTGIGISPDRVTSIFDRFEQEDVSTSRRFGGSGLGLSIAKSMAESMGGTIHCESSSTGSCFTVSLNFGAVFFPDHDNAGAKQQAESDNEGNSEAVAPRVSERLRILVAEDNVLNQIVAKRALPEHDLVVVGNGAEALEALQSQGEFDLVLMDVQMPLMDGLEATRRWRGMEALRDPEITPIPIIALTAQAFDGDYEKCIMAGMDGHISKPFRPSTIGETIARFLENLGTTAERRGRWGDVSTSVPTKPSLPAGSASSPYPRR